MPVFNPLWVDVCTPSPWMIVMMAMAMVIAMMMVLIMVISILEVFRQVCRLYQSEYQSFHRLGILIQSKILHNESIVYAQSFTWTTLLLLMYGSHTPGSHIGSQPNTPVQVGSQADSRQRLIISI